MADLNAKLQQDLTREADNRQQMERVNSKLNSEIFQLTARIEEVEAASRSAAKNKVTSLEMKIRQMEGDIGNEQKIRQESQHQIKQLSRQIQEMQFNSEEDHKTIHKLQNTIEFQNNKMKGQRRTIDDQEAQIQVVQNKLRKALQDTEEAQIQVVQNKLR